MVFAAGIFVFLLSTQSIFAQDLPSLKADSKAVEYGLKAAAAEGLSWEDLAEISLWASGAEDPYAPAARGKPSFMDIIRGAATEITRAEDFPRGERERGEYILDFMFAKFLKSYSENQTRIDTLLVSGSYNCVSSAVFFVILARAAGLDAGGVITRDHAFVRILSGDEEIDVETTNPYGFDPGNRRDFHDRFGRVTGFAYVPAQNYRNRAAITPLELAALIFDNRIAGLESRGRFAEALSLALNREALLTAGEQAASAAAPTRAASAAPSPGLFAEPRKLAEDRIFNYGADLIRQGRESDALRWADLAAASRPDETRWNELIDAALNNLIAKLAAAKRFSEAWELLAAGEKRLTVSQAQAPLLAKLASARKALAGAELSSLAASVKNTSGADAALDVVTRNPRGAEPEIVRELSIFLTLKKGEFTAKEQSWRAAIAFTAGAAAEYRDRRLEEQLKAFTANRIAELHNSFAAAYNRKDFENAQNIIRAALEEFPGNSRFLRDMELVERALR